MTWLAYHQRSAEADGWGLFENSDHGGHRIERLDAVRRFDCDEAARAYVSLRAVRGDPLCRKAVEYLAHYYGVEDAAETERMM